MTKIPVTIVTGFLGSGKTTLISSLLKQLPDRRLAILVNEYGEISVDGMLIKESHKKCGSEHCQDLEIIDLPGGCICCCVQEDFFPMMQKIADKDKKVDHVIVETSGLAVPTPITNALYWPELLPYYELDALIMVVDTPFFLENKNYYSLEEEKIKDENPHSDKGIDDIFMEQLENADIVVLNKIDDLSEKEISLASERLREKAPKIKFIETAFHGKMDPRICLGLHLHSVSLHAPHSHGDGNKRHSHSSQELFDGHSHGDLGKHEHGEGSHTHFHEHDIGWQSFALSPKKEIDLSKIKQAFESIVKDEPIFRAKGKVCIKENDNSYTVQVVQKRIESYFSPENMTLDKAKIVFIGYYPSRKKTKGILERETGVTWV